MNVDYTNLAFSLGIVIALIVPVVWILKKISIIRQSKSNISILDKKIVSAGVYISIAKILSKYYIIGISSGGVSLIKEITSKDDLSLISSSYNVKYDFKDVLKDELDNNYDNLGLSRHKKNFKSHLDKLENLVLKK